MPVSGSDPAHAVLLQKLTDSLEQLPPSATPRRIHGPDRFPAKATAVIGMRRAGKTTFLQQVRRDRVAAGVPLERLPFINLEDERLVDLGPDSLGTIVQEYHRRLPDLPAGAAVTWCFDEIQVVPGWERFVRRLLDSESVEVFLTGSSAALLSREIATALRGRAWEVLLHPFSFGESLLHRGIDPPTDSAPLSSRRRSSIEHAFLDYLRIGGFPEAQGLDVPIHRQLLRDYVDVAMLRDVVERHEVRNVTGLRWLVRRLLGNAAGLFSVEKFHAALKSQGIAISRDTVHELLAHLEDCFLVRTVWMESQSERQRMVNPRKSYPVDPGLIPVFDRSGKANVGHALETAVLIELERRHSEVTYVRTPKGHEVDFLARLPEGGMELIQVCASLGSNETTERKIRALMEAKAIWPNASMRLLTLNMESKSSDWPEEITVQPAYEWMLSRGEAESRAGPAS